MNSSIRLMAVTAVCGAATAVAGCGPASGANPPDSPSRFLTVSVSPTPESAAASVQRAVAAYRGMWDVFVAASNSGAADAPDLASYASAAALSTLRKGLASNKSQGVHSQGAPKSAPTVTSVSPSDTPATVTIGDCLDSTSWLIYRSDGELLNDVPGGRRKASATVERTGDVWKVTSFAVMGVGTC